MKDMPIQHSSISQYYCVEFTYKDNIMKMWYGTHYWMLAV